MTTQATKPKGKRVLVVTDPTLMVRRANERLVMVRDGKEVAAVPLRELSHVALHGPVTMTGAALAGVLDEGIDVSLYSSFGRYRGMIASAVSKNVFLRLAQADAWRREERKVAFARALLGSKIEGQRAMLQRHARDRGSVRCRAAAESLRGRIGSLAVEETLEGLRGVEGAAAAEYFEVFGEMLSEGWSFPGRVRRPARDPVNALLNFGYVLATGEVVRVLTHGGFDTFIGLVHGLRYGRESLALDLVEEFRAPMVDRFTLRLINNRQVTREEFVETDEGGVRLSAEARGRYLDLWAVMLKERVAVLRGEGESQDEGAQPRTERIERLEDEADAGADEDEAEPGEVLTWRYRIERQVSRLRRFLMNEEPYRPLVEAGKPRKPAKTGSHEGPR